MTYMALSAGYRGLGFLGDADLTRPAGRALLIEMAFLNEEIDLLESVLARSSDPIPDYFAFDPPPPDLPPPGAPPGIEDPARRRSSHPSPSCLPPPSLSSDEGRSCC